MIFPSQTGKASYANRKVVLFPGRVRNGRKGKERNMPQDESTMTTKKTP